VQLMGANSLLAGRHQVSGLKPDVQFNVAILENRPDSHCELALARATAAQTGARTLDSSNAIKPTTAGAMWAFRPHNCFKARNGSGLAMEVWLGKYTHCLTP
jgi:hypothetical protein